MDRVEEYSQEEVEGAAIKGVSVAVCARRCSSPGGTCGAAGEESAMSGVHYHP